MSLENIDVIRQPNFDDFIYTILYNSDYKQKRGLQGKFMKAATDEKAAKRFVRKASKEEKEFILAHFGFEFYYVIAKRGMTISKMKDIMREFEIKKNSVSMQQLAEAGLFVIGDKTFIHAMGIAELKAHHPSFTLNLELARQGYNIKKWSSRNFGKYEQELMEHKEAGRMFCKLLLSSTFALNLIQSTEGLSRNEMLVLLHLYIWHYKFVGDDEIYHYFFDILKKVQYRHVMKKLRERELIRLNIQNKTREYTITGQGIRIINLFLIETASKNYQQ